MDRCVLAVILSASLIGLAAAETVSVKYQGPVPLDTFQCADVDRDNNINRVCYDAAQQYMIIKLGRTYYHYCEIDAGTVGNLFAAASMNQYFQSHIRGTGTDGPFDCRTHQVPEY